MFARGLLLASYAHIIIEAYKQDGVVPIRINMQANVAASIKSAREASDIHLAAVTNGPGVEVPVTDVPPVTASITATPVNPSTLTETQIQVSTATDGDLILQIQNAKAVSWLQTQAKQPCNSTDSKKSRRSYELHNLPQMQWRHSQTILSTSRASRIWLLW